MKITFASADEKAREIARLTEILNGKEQIYRLAQNRVTSAGNAWNLAKYDLELARSGKVSKR